MDTDTYSVPLGDLAALGVPRGIAVTRQWVSKYTRAGLLPDESTTPGLGRGIGRQTYYSEAVRRQIVPLIQALDAYGKNLPAVGWALWWNCYYAHPRYWRDVLTQEAKTWDGVRSFFSASEELGDDTQQKLADLTQQLESRRDLGGFVGAIKRHAPGSMSSVMEIVLSVLNGTFFPLDVQSNDPYQMEIAQKAFGKSLSIPVIDTPNTELRFNVSVQALSGQMEVLSGLMNRNMETFFSQVGDDELNAARDEISVFMYGIGGLEKFSQKRLGHTLGAKMFAWGNQAQGNQVNWLLGWLLMRENPVMRDGIANLNEIIKTQEQLIRMGKIWEAPLKKR